MKGRSIADVALPELSDVLLEGLEDALRPPAEATKPDVPPAAAAVNGQSNGHMLTFDGYHVAPSTARFLSGQHAESSQWNLRLFRAACDLNARGVPRAQAEDLLLEGAKPKTPDDDRAARDTIASAFSQPRQPSRY